MPRVRQRKDDALALALMRIARGVRIRIASVAQPSDGCGTSLAIAVLWQTSVIGRPRLKELADALHVSPPTLTPIVASLVRAGHLTRTRDAGDARAARFVLTPSGKRAHAAGLRTLVTAVERMLAPLAPAERRSLLSLLTKLA